MSITTAVIVTYNSGAVITQLLNTLLSQSYQLSNIIVVDNASTDNTRHLIEQINHPIVYLYSLAKNLGGAGGFAYGLQKALEVGSDIIFTFDDDAIPASVDYIATMLAFKSKTDFDVISPLVVDSNNHAEAAFSYQIGTEKITKTNTIQQLSSTIPDIKLFNGVLFDCRVIAELGGPRPEFFIRGDEQEFKIRIIQAGYKFVTYTPCVVYHPSSVGEYIEVKGKHFHHLDSAFKLFYSTRNRYYMMKLREDFSLLKKIRITWQEFWRYSWFYLIYRRGDLANYWLWLRALCFGLVGYMNNDLIKK